MSAGDSMTYCGHCGYALDDNNRSFHVARKCNSSAYGIPLTPDAAPERDALPLKETCRRALLRLYIATDEDVAADIDAEVGAYLRQLEAERDQYRACIDTTRTDGWRAKSFGDWTREDCADYAVAYHQQLARTAEAANTTLRAQVAACEGDKERLEWAQRNVSQISVLDPENDANVWIVWGNDDEPQESSGPTLREAIDNARAAVRP